MATSPSPRRACSHSATSLTLSGPPTPTGTTFTRCTVRPYDGRYYGSFDVTVTVTDVNERPTITTTSSSATALRQNENVTSRLYTYQATDPEGADTVTWSVGGVDERFFDIDERGGQFSFKEANPPNYEEPADSGGDNVYNVVVQATDDGGNPDTLDVTVTVANDAEGEEPTITTRRPPATYRENGTSHGLHIPSLRAAARPHRMVSGGHG